MDLDGCVALVTGANRGLGKAFATGLLRAGAAKVYGAARNPDTIGDAGVVPVRLDVTDPDQVAAAARQCRDVTVLVNNAGIFEIGPLLGEGAVGSLRRQLEVNALGPLSVATSFAPAIAANGGGAIVTMLSVTSWFTTPFSPAYSASKHAALALTNGLRLELAGRHIHVVGVYAGFIDTDMAAAVQQPKVSAHSVARSALQGLAQGRDHVFADARAEEVWRATRDDPHGFMAALPGWGTMA